MLSSFSVATNCHCFTAFTEHSERIGLPPSTWTSFTVPFAFTCTRNFTVPPIPLLFNTDGYCTATIFMAFPLKMTSCAPLTPAFIAAPATRRQILLVLFPIEFRPSHHAAQAAPCPGIPQDALKNEQALLHTPSKFPRFRQKLTTSIALIYNWLLARLNLPNIPSNAPQPQPSAF